MANRKNKDAVNTIGTKLFLYFSVIKKGSEKDLFVKVRNMLLNKSVLNTIARTSPKECSPE